MKQVLFFVLITVCFSCVPLTQSSDNSGSNPKELKFSDFAYEAEIKTILLHPLTGDNLSPAVTQFGDWILLLEFDDLRRQRDNYYVRIVHCNHDWSKSDLMDIEYMTDYNEFNINNFQYSVDTHIPYVHYTFPLPAVKVPGNYLAVVYRNGDKSDIVLSKRFMVYDPRISFLKNGSLISSGKVAASNQQLNFTLSYKDLDIPNPLSSVWVVIRQNQRWDNMAIDVKPSFVRTIEHELDYNFFDDSKMFKGGNEFRFFDLRSLGYPGRNVASVNKTIKPFEAYIEKDKDRSHTVYSQYRDMDGNFIVANLDYNDANFTNYVNVNFTLASTAIQGDVYVGGAFNYWNLNRDNKMVFDSARQEYSARVLLKQGVYDYQYVVKSPSLPTYYFEGTHYETQNSYEIFVYYKPLQPRAEQLIGYIKMEANPR
jgi:hypothetical protein